MVGLSVHHTILLFVQNTARLVKIKEYTYIRPDAAGRRLKKLLVGQEHELIVCTHDHIQHLKPEQYITDNDKENFYPK